MITDNINRLYFIGAGGIGMSALARYFNYRKLKVAGHDLTRTPLTDKLMAEGIDISFIDDSQSAEAEYPAESATEDTLVVYTPAIPSDNNILRYFKTNGFRMVKRSVLLGELVNRGKGIAIAGTHGKTSVSVLTAHLLNQSPSGCNAFLGGVSKNYDSNLMVSEKSDLIVVEADEYDRSFLKLFPQIAVITSIDADHLDIYGSYGEMKTAFSTFASQVSSGGTIIYKKGLEFEANLGRNIVMVSYGIDNGADYQAVNIRIPTDGLPVFDLVSPYGEYRNLKLGVPGRFNVENAVAATAVALICNISEVEIRKGLENFKGVNRRFDIRLNTPECVFIDDYAHHPAELKACISSVREWFPGRKVTGIFQPHLFSRTRDFADGFAESLDNLDNLVLLDIYPAREKPLPGVTSGLIFDKVRLENKIMCSKDELTKVMANMPADVVITMGAGSIDTMVEPVMNVLLNKIKGKL